VHDVVDVAPLREGVAASEDAVPVADLDRPPDGGVRGALAAAGVEREPVGAGDDPDDSGVAGQPPRGLGCDRAGPAQFAAGDAGRTPGGAEGLPVDGDPNVRSLAAHVGQPSAVERAPGQSDQGVGLPFGVAAGVARRPIAVHQRGQRGVQVLPADGIQVTAQVHPSVEAARHGEPPAGVRRVVQGPVGIHSRDPAGHTLSRLVRGRAAGQVGQDAVGLGQVDARLGGPGDPARRHRAGDDPGVRGGDLPGGERRGRGRQVLEPPSRRDRRRGLRRADPAAADQPALHGDRAVAAVGLPAVGRPHGGRERGGEAVRGGAQLPDQVQQRVVGQVGEVGLGQVVEGGTQFGHRSLLPPPGTGPTGRR
jgi:hypothetical protein